MQHFDDYQTFTDTTLALPLTQANNIGYATLGLIGEVGEYAEKINTLIAHNLRILSHRSLPPSSDSDEIVSTTHELLNLLQEVATICIRADKLKKEIRGGQKKLPAAVIYSIEERDELAKELGDLCWYAARASSSLRLTFSQVIDMNVKKLLQRLQKGVIHGSGDNR